LTSMRTKAGIATAAALSVIAIGALAPAGDAASGVCGSDSGSGGTGATGSGSSCDSGKYVNPFKHQSWYAGRIDMGVDFTGDERPVLADPIQIQQVVFNLVRNALEATEGKTPREIIVATRAATTAELEISVADTGSRLPKGPEAVFQPFAASKAKGMGIGLSICRTIVEAHGGCLWAEHRPGGGAVFRFTLPAAAPEEAIHG